MVAKTYNNMHDVIQVEQLEKIDLFIQFLQRSSGALRKKDTITVLHQAQRICGKVTIEVQQYIAQKLGVNMREIEDAVNFYEYFAKESSSDRILSPC